MKFKNIALILASLLTLSAASCGVVETLDDTSVAVSGSSELDDSLEDITETTSTTATTTAASTEAETTVTTTTTAAAEEDEASQAEESAADVQDDGGDSQDYYTSSDDVSSADTVAEAATEAPTEAAAQTVGSFSSSDLTFSGTSLLGDASGLIGSLGAASDVAKAQGCLSNGADMKIYYYSGLEVSCYVSGGSEYVYDITITGGYSTPKGIYVGSSRTDAVAAYGEGVDYGSYVLYGSDGYGMYIYYSGDTVSCIEYYADV